MTIKKMQCDNTFDCGCDDRNVLDMVLDDQMRARVRRALLLPGEAMRNMHYQEWRDEYARGRDEDGRACRLEGWYIHITMRAVWHE